MGRLAPLACVCSIALPNVATAQTWTGDRSTPNLEELLAVDATGEQGWPFGAEDIGENGANTFTRAEQRADIRSAYGAVGQDRLWLRVYVSDATSVGNNVRVFAFIDVDRNPNTGGTADAAEIDADLSADLSAGGYDFAIGLRGSTGGFGIWQYTNGTGQFESQDLLDFSVLSEDGEDLDPLRLVSDRHGYVQAAVLAEPLQLALACEATLLFRSTDTMGLADLDVGQAGPCVPGDSNGNSVADIAEAATETACDTDAQCVGDSRCTEGVCSPIGGPGGGDSVPATGDPLDPDLVVQGGALTCAVEPSKTAPSGWGDAWWVLAGLGIAAGRRRSAGGRGQP
jgi:MYXO-CTERM domain-containing protein